MKKLFLLFIGILVAGATFAQTEVYNSTQPAFDGFHKNIFVEGLGAGLLGSVNYDMRLQRGRMDGIGFRAGIGGANLNGTDDYGEPAHIGIITVPLEFNYLVGKKRSSFLAGIGLLPIYASVQGNGTINTTGERAFIDAEGFGFAGYLSLGYRFQPLRNGFMFQINWNPLISKSGFSPAWLGLSIGYGFK